MKGVERRCLEDHYMGLRQLETRKAAYYFDVSIPYQLRCSMCGEELSMNTAYGRFLTGWII